ncbi:MAG: hypothetical protein II697_01465 [Clostridia bacterium]|nr:hypothetical protein [Clostridia bacterium]
MALSFQQEQEQKIALWLKNLKFRKRIFGGVRESDVFKKISELDDMYKEALLAERARYDALLSQQAADPTQSETPGDSEAGNQT